MKTVFTTGEAAEICKMSQQTITRCFDSGRLKGFRMPGSRFRRIPRDALISFMKAQGIPMDALDDGKCRILIIDDDPTILEMLTDVLERDGRFEVRTAQGGYDAGLETARFQPHLIIVDYMLPDINGYAMIESIRKNPDLKDVKIILISAIVNQDEINELLQAGANEFVKKPFNIERMIERIAELLKEPAATKESPTTSIAVA